MKKRLFRHVLSIFLLAAVVHATEARQISAEEARTIASDVLCSPAARAVNPSIKIKRADVSQDNNCRRPYYIFTTEGSCGFVIVGGDDRLPKIIGSSTNGTLDAGNLPPQLAAILKGLEEKQQSGDSRVHPSWGTPSLAASSGDVLLHTAEWDQIEPYNMFTPEINGVKSPTGCVATAMAIVMQYHKWPEHGRSWDLQPEDFENIVFDNDDNVYDNLIHKQFSDYVFDYTLMPDKLTNESGDAQKRAVGQLMDAAGKAVRSVYGEAETGALFQVVAHEMLEKFAYSPESELLMLSDYNWEEWLSIIRDQLDNGLPVMYGGSGDIGRHAYVVDGYNSDGMYHINWGWGGNANGYFSLDATNFSWQAQMVVNVKPDRSGRRYSRVYTSKDDIYTNFEETDIMMPSVENIEKGKEFDITYPTLRYFATQNYILALGLTDKFGNLKEISDNYRIDNFSMEYFQYGVMAYDGILKKQKFNSEIMPDDYVQFFTQEEGSDEWLPVNGCSNIPTRIPVIGNHPRLSTVRFNIDHDNIYYVIRDYNAQDKVLFSSWDNSVSEHKFLFGDSMVLDMYVRDGKNGYSVGKIYGKYAYGDVQTKAFNHIEPFCMAFKCMDYEYIIEAELLEYAPASAIHTDQAGSLAELIPAADAVYTGDLTLSGPINALDLWHIRKNMPALFNLNLSGADIEECSTPEYYIETFPVAPVQSKNTMPDWSFEGMNALKTIALPESLEAFGNLSVSGTAISSIVIPENVVWMGTNTFFMCQNLETVVSKNPEPPEALDCIFDNWSRLIQFGTLYVPDGSVDAYRQAPSWGRIPNIRPLSEYSGMGEVIEDAVPRTVRIYNLHGCYMGGDADGLPEGIYIVTNGEKSWKIKK